ncbi:MAG: aminoacyl-tRNA hydrolase [Verrucomicrobia bacterium]|nr:aminoacyl-tRNA hydrolase [Verrucomicrobiota bacterium]
MPAGTKLVVGLGNPGPEYAGTRHNIGFAVVEQFAANHTGSFKRKWRFAAEVAEIAPGDGKVVVAKPQTYMNRSGVTVAAMLSWLKIAPAEMLVVVDDADLPLGQVRLRESGGSGGHNGLRSIIEALGGCEEFARLRVGIGRVGEVGADLTGHVLGRFSASEREVAARIVGEAAEALDCCVKEGLTTAMNRYNRKAPPKAD